jgi:hypothetical protein
MHHVLCITCEMCKSASLPHLTDLIDGYTIDES